MRWRRFATRLLSSLTGRREEDRLKEEIDEHLTLLTDELIRAGRSPADAHRQAKVALGSTDAFTEAYRDEQRLRWLENLWQDGRYAFRILARSRAFTTVAVLSLALGIGAATAMFQLLDAVRLRNLPVASPGSLRTIEIGGEGPSGNFTARFSDLSTAQWEEIADRQEAFASIAAWSVRRFNLAESGEVRHAEGMLVSGAFFDTLGVSASRGRVLGRADDRPGCSSPAAVVSHAFWRRELAGDPAAIGRLLRVDGHAFTIAGITPASFFGVEVGRSYDIAIPLCAEQLLSGANSQLIVRRHNYWLSALGRLRHDLTLEHADAHLRAISPQVFSTSLPSEMSAEDRAEYLAMWLHSVPAGHGLSWLRVDYERPLWLLLASAVLVLVIVCANVANLLLARASVRAPEIAVRLALGASRGRVVMQLLTESLILSGAGAALGLGIATLMSQGLLSLLVTADNPVSLVLEPDWRALLFVCGAAAVTSVTFGLIPALRAATSVRTGVKGVATGHQRSGVVRLLVAGQVTLCIVLVSAAMLFGRSLHNLLTTELGFQADAILIASVDTRRLGFDEERQKVLFRELLEQFRRTPGVVAAAQSNIVPISGWESRIGLVLGDGREASARTSSVSPGYFRAMGTPIIAGTDFDPLEGEHSETMAIVNEAFARTFLNGANPIGVRFRLDGNIPARVIGLVANTKYRSLTEAFEPIVFVATTQRTTAQNYARFVIRFNRPSQEASQATRSSIALISPSIDVELLPLATQIRESVVRARLMAVLGVSYGVLALLLAALGVYGVLAYSVHVRHQEIGIRMALGADRGRIVGLVVREAAWLLGAGITAGLAVTLAAGQAVASLLYGLAPNDVATLSAAVTVLLCFGLGATWIPARRAAMVDPAAVIRQSS